MNSSDDDYNSSIYMEIERTAIGYYFIFDDAINIIKTNVTNNYGIIIKNATNYWASDEVVLSVPSDIVKTELMVTEALAPKITSDNNVSSISSSGATIL